MQPHQQQLEVVVGKICGEIVKHFLSAIQQNMPSEVKFGLTAKPSVTTGLASNQDRNLATQAYNNRILPVDENLTD